jgi:hypothetical protein
MSPEQTIYGSMVKGGWFVGGVKLKKALALIGVPTEAPQPPPSARHEPPAQASGSGLSARDVGAIAVGAVILVLAVLLAIHAMRRSRRTIAT